MVNLAHGFFIIICKDNRNMVDRFNLLGNENYSLVYVTTQGHLFHGDCMHLFQDLPESCIDMIFADPPFNLGKNYGKDVQDNRKREDYLNWSKRWLTESVRVLRPGGSLFVFNLPVWLIEYGAFLNSLGMCFRHWIACRMPKSFPRGKKLSPAHYGLLYYTKGEPKTFHKVYTPIVTCRHCGKEIRDYGGHRSKLNKQGINLMDIFDISEDVWEKDGIEEQLWTPIEEIWDDIPPVRHRKYKTRTANELAPLMLERIIALSTNPEDIVLDPFGGSGTTFYAAEKLKRRWLGIEIGEITAAIHRLQDYQNGQYVDWESARGQMATKKYAGKQESNSQYQNCQEQK